VLGLLLLLLPGAIIVLGVLAVLTYLQISAAMKTSDAYLERYRARLAWELILAFRTGASAAVGRAMIGIFDRENKDRKPPPLVGDRALPGGPSIGPGQVYRARAIALGLIPPDTTAEQYELLAGEEDLLVGWAVRVFKFHFDQAKGDVAKAIELYNGSGPAAEQYKSDVLAFLQEQFGDAPIGPPAEVA
jgi:hypothetical protein